MAISFGSDFHGGGATSSAGNITCAEPHTAAKCAAAALPPSRPATCSSPRTAPHDVHGRPPILTVGAMNADKQLHLRDRVQPRQMALRQPLPRL